MAAKSLARAEKPKRAPLPWRYIATVGLLTLLAMSLLFGAQQVEQFLIRDARFVLTPPAEYGEESPNLHLTGVQFAPRNQVLRVFQQDVGRSIYLFPLAERRKALLRVAWVKDAAIYRTWPNQIAVAVRERKPVAFVQMRGDSISRWSLIDADGIILDPPAKTPFQLPVITGVKPEEAAAVRGVRVRRMMRMLDDLGDNRSKISEVDVADLDNLKATLKVSEHAVVLILGDRNFRTRFQNFQDHYDEIQKRISGATVLDLRLDDRITVIGGKREE